MTVINTNNGTQYKTPSVLTTTGAVAAGMATSGASSLLAEPIGGLAIKRIRKINQSINTAELEKFMKEAFNMSGMKNAGVKVKVFNPAVTLSQTQILRNLFSPKLGIGGASGFGSYMIELIKHGYNAGFAGPIANSILINPDKMGSSFFHELGHAINYNTSKFWKTLQLSRNPLMMLGGMLVLTALLKRKKAEGEEPKGLWDKTTTFIKNNVGKLTTLSFVPIIAEELMATARGNKIAKQILNPEMLKKVVTSNRWGAASYIGAAIVAGVGAYAANKVRDAIAKPKKIA